MYHVQTSLFYNLQELVRNSSLLRKYYYLFQALDLSILPDKNNGIGRTGHSQHAILRAFIVKHLQQIKSVPQLIEYIEAIPPLMELCGFTLGDMLEESRFYRFQTETDNAILKEIHHRLNHRLIEQGLVSLDTLITDSKPIMAATRENNLKNPARNSTCKSKKPARNPAATLSCYSCQILNGKKENMIFFWGYRTHIIISREGIALVEITLPNNITDQEVAFKLLRELKRRYKLKKGFLFLADKAYDVRELYTFIVEQMKGNPYISINPRNQQDDKTFGPHGCPICEGGMEMKSAGRWNEGNRERLKFRCPLKTGKKVAAQYNNTCPINHSSFNTGKCYGCTQYLDVTDDARSRVPRDSKEFKETFKDREFVEQYFAHMGDREAEQTTHYALKTVRNQITIAHLTASLIGVAAAILLKEPEKMRCHKTFAQLPRQRRTG